ncbi:MAG: hypothetical protein ABMA64_14625 [Myxococcota bacterium]
MSRRWIGGWVFSAGCVVGWDPQPADPTFPLVGEHAPLACAACHPDATPPAAISPACASCHESARPADHYSGDCGICHTPFGWDQVVVDHGFFPLTNAHALGCDQCHAPGTYEGLDPACASCHEPDRPGGHFGVQDCGSCHHPTEWGDAEFDHDSLFRLPHEGVADCESCHLVPDDYSSFSCVDCHEHSKSSTDNEHDEVGNYVYDSDACLDCHPNGGD